MADTVTESLDHVDEHDDHDHPSDWVYIKIALWLALFTAIEVATYFFEDTAPRSVLFLVLTVLMIIKFIMVIAYFMHLKYDTPWFRRVFIAGLGLAIAVYAIVFFAYDYFDLVG